MPIEHSYPESLVDKPQVGATMSYNRIMGGGNEGSTWASVFVSSMGSVGESGVTPLEPTSLVSWRDLSRVA